MADELIQGNDEAMRWLLKFAEKDLGGLPAGQMRDLVHGVVSFSGRHGPDTIVIYDPPVTAVSREQLERLQGELRNAFDALEHGKPWTPAIEPPEWYLRPLPVIRDGVQVPGVLRGYRGSVEQVFYWKIGDVLTNSWVRVQRCSGVDCNRRFIPNDPRQTYCTPECSQRTRWAKFQPKRKRDYEKEYDARVSKKYPGKVRARHQPGKRKSL